MVSIQNLDRLKKKFMDRIIEGRKEGKRASVCVGYCTNYALQVHEDLEARHKPGKSARYLSRPCKEFEGELAFIVRKALASGKADLSQALLLAGLRLQRESQKIVPIDTSALKASAFTCLEEELEDVSYQSYIKGLGIRGQKSFVRRVKQARRVARRRKKT